MSKGEGNATKTGSPDSKKQKGEEAPSTTEAVSTMSKGEGNATKTGSPDSNKQKGEEAPSTTEAGCSLGSQKTRLKHSYVMWNNKGGAGKTTLTFHLSTQYALDHPEQDVVVIDMCPQANISAALLSGLGTEAEGKQGDENVKSLIRKKIKCFDVDGNAAEYEQTICGYLMAKINKVGIKYSEFLVKPRKFNKYPGENMYLLCGDRYLELVARRLEQERGLHSTNDNPWKRVTLFVKTFVDEVFKTRERDYVCFIDTNPSFAIYTELAVSAADRLIIPINSDDFSRTAVEAMLYLIFGEKRDEDRDPRYEEFRKNEYSAKAKALGIKRPTIFAIVKNKMIKYKKKDNIAKSYKIKAEQISKLIREVHETKPELFVPDGEKYEFYLPDFHSMAVQCLHLGCPLSKLPQSFLMDENETVANPGKSNTYIKSLKEIVNHL